MADEVEQQNISQQDVEQITKTPDPKPKVKNPKKIAAGKKLAEYNKKGKEQQQLVQENNDEEKINEKSNWLPETSFSTVITVLGLGPRAIDLFFKI